MVGIVAFMRYTYSTLMSEIPTFMHLILAWDHSDLTSLVVSRAALSVGAAAAAAVAVALCCFAVALLPLCCWCWCWCWWWWWWFRFVLHAAKEIQSDAHYVHHPKTESTESHRERPEDSIVAKPIRKT